LIVEEAGGMVSNEYGNSYNMFEDRCIVASNRFIHEEFVEILEKN